MDQNYYLLTVPGVENRGENGPTKGEGLPHQNQMTEEWVRGKLSESGVDRRTLETGGGNQWWRIALSDATRQRPTLRKDHPYTG